MTVAACGIAGGACSSLLGLDDPRPATDGGGGGDGPSGGDGPIADRLMFDIGDFRIARLQRVRVHVTAVLPDSSTQDVTTIASYASDDRAIADVSMPGHIDGGSTAGVATISASLGAAQPGTAQVTVRDKDCQPVINEFQTAGATADDEWVEILNPCTGMIDVAGWTLVYRGAATTGTTDSTLLVTLTGQMAPGELRLYVGPAFVGTATRDGEWTTGALGGASGAIGLRSGPKDTGPLVDAVAYGAVSTTPRHPFIETSPLMTMSAGRPAQRLPYDGHDEDNGLADFMQVQAGTPRALNAP